MEKVSPKMPHPSVQRSAMKNFLSDAQIAEVFSILEAAKKPYAGYMVQPMNTTQKECPEPTFRFDIGFNAVLPER